jgi:hypothetical protein
MGDVAVGVGVTVAVGVTVIAGKVAPDWHLHTMG